MPEPLSYKELEALVKELKQEKKHFQDQLNQKEHQLISIEKLYKQIVDNVKEGVFIIQGETFKFINQEVLELFNAGKKDFENAKFSELIHPDNRGQIIREISDLIELKKEKIASNCKLVSFDGRILFVDLEAERLPLINKQNSILVKILNAEKAIQQETKINNLEKAYQLLNNNSNEPFFILENQTNTARVFAWKIIEVNKAGEKLAGLPKASVLEYTLENLFSVDYDVQQTESWNNETFENFELYIENLKKYCRFQFKLQAKNQIICVITDIHDLFITKAQLNKNLQRNELFSEVIRLFNYQISYDDKFQQVIDQINFHFKPRQVYLFEHFEGMNTGKILAKYSGENGARLSSNYELPLLRIPSWISTLQEKKMMLGFKLDYLPSDVKLYLENLKFNNAYIFPIFVEESVCGSLLFEKDGISELDNTEVNYLKMVSVLVSSLASQKRYEDNLVDAKNKAEQADRLKSSFLASMSHDIRIPMTAIIGFSDLLADPDLTIGEREEFIELISKSGQDLLTLVDNIVDVAKIETGQLKIQKDNYSIFFILNELLNEFNKDTRLIEFDDLELILDYPEEYKSIDFETDVFRFKQIFSNLIDNALKFTDQGVVHFGISNIWDDTIEFYVQDTGIGIAEETQHIIFERFGKIDRSYTKEYSGTGLGLSICKSLVELMGGHIRVVSYPGKGSTFYFSHPIPKKVVEDLTKKEEKQKPGTRDWSDKTVLIAEDVEQNYKVVEFILSPTNINIVWKKDGRQAVNYIKNGHKPDIVLMDIRMPILNGIEATKEILQLTKVPIIAQTAYTLGVERENALEAGCVDYMTKPINANKLLTKMEDIFSNPSLIE